MKILDGIEIVDLALSIDDTLIITDTQIGYEESLNKKGVLLPRFQFRDLKKRLQPIIEEVQPKTIIINGDIKHEFGTISQTEWRHTLRLIDYLQMHARLILIRGNHDTILGPIAQKKELEIKEYHMIGDIYICHGHEIPDNKDFETAKIVIIGHEHPAVALRDRGRVERYKCFLKGQYEKKDLIVQPSFNLLTEGTDVLQEKLLSPFLHDVGDFEVYVVEQGVRYFGRLKNIQL